MSLDQADFTPVIDDQFGIESSLNPSLWADHWGNADQYSFASGVLTMTGYQSQDWSPVGMIQTAAGTQAGEGYGLYSFTGYGNPGQGAGAAVLMWRADNQYLDAATPEKASEIDLFESLNGSQSVLSTIHYYDTGWANDDGQSYHTIDVDPATLHTYSVDWERGSLTYYVDGQKYYQDTTHAPLDAADGGCNEVLGAEVLGGSFNTNTSTVQLHIVSLSYSAPTSAGAAALPTLTLSQPGTVQEATSGAGVDVTETITASNQTGTVYLEVLTQTGATETGFVALDLVDGQASARVHLAHSGDLIRVVDAEVTADTTGVSITDAPAGPVTLGGGNQTYAAAAGATVQAGSGDDTIIAAAGDVTARGGGGALTFINGASASDVIAGAGSATLYGGAGGGGFTGGSAGDNVLVSQGASGANTTLTGGGTGDRIFGSGSGSDVVAVGAGAETVLGGGGPTTINGGVGGSVLFGGAGVTSVEGSSAGGDTVVGGEGSLQFTGQRGDAVFGGTGVLVVDGSVMGADSIVGGAGALAVTGRGANMLVAASTSTSDIVTGSGASLIFANAGASTIAGGAGSMQVVLGAGSATIDEGKGAATYQVIKGSAAGIDTLNGFRPASDSVNLYGYAPSQVSVAASGGSTLISLTDGTRIELVGVTEPGSSIRV
nr:glycoside hydrolase family 16 protein [uncultured Lichenicoccus sp.]